MTSTSSTRPLESSKWGAEYPAILVLVARGAVVAAPALHGLLQLLYTGKPMDNLPPLPPTDTWLGLHRKHWQLHDVLVDGFLPSCDPQIKNSQIAKLLAQLYQALARMTPEKRKELLQEVLSEVPPKEWQELWQWARQILKELQEGQNQEIRCDIAGEAEPGDDELRARMWHLPEMQFFFRVWMPSLLLYGEYPSVLMKRARHGDINAICDLLRLDKSAIAEPRIAEEFAKSYAVRGRARFRKIAKALATPSKSMSLSQVKSRLAGFISKAFAAVGHPIEAPEIQDLFDKIDADYGRGGHDSDIPTGETLTKRLQRHRKHWAIFKTPDEIKPDKNRA